MTMGWITPAAAVSPTTPAAAARWSAASSCRAATWVRLRTLSWFAGGAGSERLRRPALRTDPVAGGVVRHLALHHARLQLGQDRLRLGQREAELRECATHHRPADRD